MEHIDSIIKLQHLTLVIFCIVISVIDIKTFCIPDMLLLLLLGLLIFADCFKGYSFVLNNFLSAAIIFALFFCIFYFIGSLGFGDVKYAAVLAYGLGGRGIYLALVVATISGLFLFFVGYSFLGWNKKTRVPFAPLLSLGVIFSIIIGWGINL